MGQILLVAASLAVLGTFLVILAARTRQARGLGAGETLSLDSVTLRSGRWKLVGRPDRLVREGKFVIPEEWKSSRRATLAHKLQLATYFLLIEERYGVRPPHGFIVLGDGSRVRVENTEALRSEVLRIAREIREHRARLPEIIPADKPAAMCRACGQRANCGQSKA